MPNLTELAARCEAADGPDRALDGEPVAWMYSNADDLTPSVSSEQWREPEAQGWTEVPLFAHPPRNDAVVEALRECVSAMRDMQTGIMVHNDREIDRHVPISGPVVSAHAQALAKGLAALKQGEPR